MEEVLAIKADFLSSVEPTMLVWVEAVYLALACSSGHDYNFVKVENKDGTATFKDAADPRVTAKPFGQLLESVQAKVAVSLQSRNLLAILSMQVSTILSSATKLVFESMVEVDIKFEAKKAALEACIAGFMGHPVSVTHAEGYTPVIFEDLLVEHLDWVCRRRSARAAQPPVAAFAPTGWMPANSSSSAVSMALYTEVDAMIVVTERGRKRGSRRWATIQLSGKLLLKEGNFHGICCRL
jgi:hypothetical protein